MTITFACGRCAHQFRVSDTEQGISPVCPQCGFGHCYRLGVLPGPQIGPAQAVQPGPTAETGEQGSPQQLSPLHLSEGRSTALTPVPPHVHEPTTTSGIVRPANAWKTARRVMIVLAVVLGSTVVGLAIYYSARQRTGSVTDQETGLSWAGKPEGKPDTRGDHRGEMNLATASEPMLRDRLAHSLEEAKHAVVEFVMPLGIGDLKQYGTGFLIDGRGWVATNNHVIARATTDARVEMVDGKQLEIEGIIARAPQLDLAIVKLKDPPEDLTLLDLGYEGEIALGQDVFAFGHPYNAAFSLSKGIVSRLLSTKEWSHHAPRLPLAQQRFPDDMIWIQHDAKLSPGNSGGPLMDEQGHVFGINTFVHVKAELGYASHIKYLRELVGSAAGPLEPLPEAREAFQTAVSSQKIQSLFEAASACQWQPKTAAQYDDLTELAKQMTLAKHAWLVQRQTTKPQSDVIRRVAQVADQQFAKLQQQTWSVWQLRALSAHAEGGGHSAGEGFFAYGSILGTLPQQNAVLMKVDGTDDLIVLSGGSGLVQLPRSTKCLVLGFILPRHVNVHDKTRSVNQQAPLVLTYYVLPLET